MNDLIQMPVFSSDAARRLRLDNLRNYPTHLLLDLHELVPDKRALTATLAVLDGETTPWELRYGDH